MEALAARHPSAQRCAWSEISIYSSVARARLALAEQQPRMAVELLSAARAELEAAQDSFGRLRTEIVLVTALMAANQRTEATALFRSIVSVAGSAGFRQLLLEPEGAPLAALLPEQSGPRQSGTGHQKTQDTRPVRVAPLLTGVEALSARERSVLELIGEGQSNKEIARTLAITPETVKSHVKNIFMKLAVDTRAQAVSRAQTLGLVPTRWQLPPDLTGSGAEAARAH